jgi:hypothetical protein
VSTRHLYEIVVQGRVGDSISRAFDGFEVVSLGDGDTHFRGWVEDRSALHGALDRVRSLGLELVSVGRVEAA